MIKTVLIVLKHLNFGGTERYAINLANALVDKDIEVILVAGRGPYAPYISPKVKVFFAPILRSGKNNQISEKIILEIAKKYKPQIIHAQCRNSLLCCQLARKVLNIPVISHEHLDYKDSEYSFVTNELNRNCDKVIAITHNVASKLRKNDLEKSKLKTILNGIHLSDFPLIKKDEKRSIRKSMKLKQTDKVILCLSRIVPGKKIEQLISAFAMVSKKHPQAKLVLAGDDEWGGTIIKVQEMIKENNLTKKVLLFPAQFDIRKFHAVADIFCYPVLSKGMAVMEAMASELPIVAKESRKKPLVVEHMVQGVLTQTHEVSELADKLQFLVENPRLARQMGKAARKRIEEKFNFDKIIRSILKTYEETIKSHEMVSLKHEDMFLSATA